MNKLHKLIVTFAFISSCTYGLAETVGAQGHSGVGMNATTGTDTTGIYSSLSTSGAYGTSVGSGTGTPAVGTSNDASMRSGYLNSSAASDANGIRNLSYNATSSTDFAIRTNDVGHNVSSTSNWGWLGLIGLMGLLGSRRKVTDR